MAHSGKLYVTWYHPKTKQLEAVKTATVSKKGTISFTCQKGGTYIITRKNPILKPTFTKNTTIILGKPSRITMNHVLSNAKVTYQSNHSSVIAVSNDGIMKGLKKGI